MSFGNASITARYRVLAVVTGLIFLAGCSGGGSSTPPPAGSPTVSLSATSLTFTSEPVGTPSAGQTVTVNNTGNAALSISGIQSSGDFAIPASTNTCTSSVAAGASCTFTVTFTPTAAGSRTGTVTITDNASNSPQTVSLTGTGAASTVSLSTSSITFSTQVLVGTPSTPQPVTLTNSGGATLTIASIVPTPAAFTETDNCGTSVSAGGTCKINVTFTPTATGAATGTLTLTDNSNGVANTTQMVMLAGSGFSGNSVPVAVNFGPNGNQGPPTATTGSYYNGIYTTVTVCEPSNPTTCTAIDNVLVDTGSVGLRLLASSPTQIGSVTLTPITDSTGAYQLNECIAYADMTYTWGPVAFATVQLGGETASQVPSAEGGSANQGIPIQLIPNEATPPSAQCGNVSDDTVGLLGANGILGVGSTPQDCGATCTSANSNSPYFFCNTSSSCASPSSGVPLAYQVWNPVAAFGSADTNGVVVQLPSIPAAGAASVAGTLVFGIGTETCPGSPSGCTPNGLGSAQVYAQDANGYFPTVVFNGVTYTSPNNASYIDSGSFALFVSDAATLNSYASTQSITVSDCMAGTTDLGFYCPTPYPPALSVPLGVSGYGGVGSGTITLSIANALTLFQDNTNNAAFNNIGIESGGTGASNDSFDFGMPFFFDQPNGVFTGIMGTIPPTTVPVSAPYGYWAF